jgi:iron complex transport system substrate-binding protein
MQKKIILILGGIFLFIGVAQAGPKSSLRIISLAPATTEILFALGLEEEIVAVSSYCDYPPQAREKEKVGSFSRPDIEKILYLKPDVVFCAGLEQASIARDLRQLGLKVYVSEPLDMPELLNSILQIGRLSARERQAEGLVQAMSRDIAEIRIKAESVLPSERPRVFVEIWDEPLLAAGGRSFLGNLISLAGGINIAGRDSRAYSYLSPEQILYADPQVIILAYMDEEACLEKVSRRPGYRQLSAVKRKRVYNNIEPDTLLRPGPRSVEALRKLHGLFYAKQQ